MFQVQQLDSYRDAALSHLLTLACWGLVGEGRGGAEWVNSRAQTRDTVFLHQLCCSGISGRLISIVQPREQRVRGTLAASAGLFTVPERPLRPAVSAATGEAT